MNSSSAVSMIPLPWLKTTLALSLLFLMLSCNTIEIREQSVFDAHRTITPVDFDIPEFTLHQQTIVTDDGQHLDSWFLEHEKAHARVLYIGGSGFLMVKSRPLIEAYAKAGVHLMLFDFRGYGKSSGEPSVAGLKKDVESVFEFIEQKQADKEIQTGEATEKNLPVFIHGHSMGSLLAGWLANKKPVSGYVLESPVTNASDWTSAFVPFLLKPFIRFDIDPALTREDNVKNVSQTQAPFLIMVGDRDDVTPPRMAEKLYGVSESAQKKLVFIEGGGHNNLPVYDEYVEELKRFFKGEH